MNSQYETEQYIHPALEDFIRNYFMLVYEVPVEFRESFETPSDGSPIIEGVIHILGGWNGSLTLRCNPNTAKRLSTIMFGAEEELPEEVVYDCVRELTNVIGGNLKALLGEGSVLSIPKTIVHAGQPGFLPETVESLKTVFSFEGETIAVTLHKSTMCIEDAMRV